MNDWERQHRQAQEYKEAYPPGTRLMLLCMNDPYSPVESGTRGTVRYPVITAIGQKIYEINADLGIIKE